MSEIVFLQLLPTHHKRCYLTRSGAQGLSGSSSACFIVTAVKLFSCLRFAACSHAVRSSSFHRFVFQIETV